ncbi:MAG: Unknown protein [uncultured Sulfurovum sp.]|uniref:EF-hand domain-containing protein n=1 Tax=uncultured Sulfurovum sp. TaxID=269237 RepID=A0A6S6SYB6_9BACT|nr:MAG: Unknown protein [uncultured Sulfurovum sp.]
MKKFIFISLLVLSSLLFAEEDNNHSQHPLIQKFDKDKDGQIFYKEAPEELQDDFCQYDVNQDAYLDEVEIEAIGRETSNK